MQVIYALLSSIAGFLSLQYATTPGSRINRVLPHVRLKWVELMPSIRIIIKSRVIHVHHWLSFTILLCVSIFVTGGLLDSWLTRGFLMGGIIQGLRFPDRGILKKISQK
jgi:hypothetical protein